MWIAWGVFTFYLSVLMIVDPYSFLSPFIATHTHTHACMHVCTHASLYPEKNTGKPEYEATCTKNTHTNALSHSRIITESVDSISRDDPDMSYM